MGLYNMPQNHYTKLVLESKIVSLKVYNKAYVHATFFSNTNKLSNSTENREKQVNKLFFNKLKSNHQKGLFL